VVTQRASTVARRLTWAALALACLLALLAAAATWGLPRLLRSQLPVVLGETLGRPVSVGEVAINPFTLRFALADLSIGEHGAAEPALRVASVAAQGSWRSLIAGAPVIAGLRIDGLRARLARDADGRLSIDDVLARLRARPPEPAGPPPRFVLEGAELADAEFVLDDRQVGRAHRLASIGLTLSRLSSLPADRERPVEALLALELDGVPLRARASLLAFAPVRSASVELELSPLALPTYLGYLPRDLPIQLRQGSLSTSLRIEATLPVDADPTLSIAGDATFAGVDLRAPDGGDLLAFDALRVRGIAAQPLASRIEIGGVELDAPRVAVLRRAAEPRFFESVLRALPQVQRSAAAEPAPTGAAASEGFRWSVGELVLRDGRVELRDERFTPQPLALRLEGLALRLGRVSDAFEPTPFELAVAADGGERVAAKGSLRAQPLIVDADIAVDAVPLRRWWWMAAPGLQADLVDGTLGLKTRVNLEDQGAGPALRLSDLSVKLGSLVLRQRWNARELLALPSVTLTGSSLDLAARRVALAAAATAGAASTGRAPEPVSPTVRPPASAPVAAAAPSWRVSLAQFALSGASVSFRQLGSGTRGTAASSEASLRELSLRVEGLSDEPGRRARVALRTRVGDAGRLEATGSVGLAPMAAQLRVDARAIGLLPARPFVAERLRMDLAAGAVSARGDLALALPAGHAPKVAWKGDLHLADFHALTRRGEELLRWRALSVEGVEASIAPLSVAIAQVALEDFYSRLIIDPQGRFNLQDLAVDETPPAAAPPATGAPLASTDAAATPATADAAATPVPAATASAPATPVPAATASAPAEAPAALPVRIGRIALVNGNIDFSDRFIRPNYSANLTGMTGFVSALGPDTAGELLLRGRVDNAGSVEIAGTINPFASTLQLDLKAQARDIDLPRATPYAVKYLGYGIEKGKLSARLQYRIVGRQLEADNEITLDQLTFGERVESPTATQLPVLFAVSLLKDRHGVIDVKLPISGSLDDPQFSVGGLVLRIIFNLIAKAVTAPFTLLANLFGGGDGEISQIDFDAGRSALREGAAERLGTLARALGDRPALRLDLAGRADPATDEAALRLQAFERRLKTAKLRLAGAPVPAGGLDAVVVEEAERPRLLLAAWRAGEFPKPRDDQGRLREQPPEVMARMLLDDIRIDEAALVALADARAQAAKEWLIGRGIEGERLFVVAPKTGGEGAGARVELTLR